MQEKCEVLAFQIERDVLVVEGGAAIAQFEAADAEIEERFLPGSFAGGNLRRRNVAGAIFREAHGESRMLCDELINFELAAEKRKDGDADVHAVDVKQRKFGRSFQAVQGEVIEFGLPVQEMKMKTSQFDTRAGARLNLMDERVANPMIH